VVQLAITENTTYNFVLYPDIVYPTINGSFCNGWWNSPVEVSFSYNPEDVAQIWYYYNGWHLYTEPFVLDEDGLVIIDYYWIDFEGVQSAIYTFELAMDFTPPAIDISWEVYRQGLRFYVKFDIVAEDSLSGMDSYLQFYINDVLQAEFWVMNWDDVEIEIPWSKNIKYFTFGFGCSDFACNYVIESINGSDIKSFNLNQKLISNNPFYIFYNRISQHFPSIFSVILKNYL
jgi:hypothetical protein